MRRQKGLDCNYKLKICVICQDEYKPTTGKQYACIKCSKIYAKQKHREQAKARGRKRKLMAVDYLGGRCNDCGGQFHPAIFEFHHENPEEKDLDPSQALQMAWDNFKKELEKCVLLCANCHRYRHHNYDNDRM